MHGEPHAGLREKNASREEHDALVQTEEDDSECKTRSGVFGVQARPNGRRQVAYDGFSDAVETERHRGAAKTVLKQPDDHAQKKTGGGIATAQAKINGDQQRQIDHRGFRKINGHESLKHQSEQRGANDGSATKLMHLDVRFHVADVECVVHSGFTAVTASAEAGTGVRETGAGAGLAAVSLTGDFTVPPIGLLATLAEGFAVSVS